MDRRQSNPVFNDRKLKLGTFQTNLDSGCVMSDLDGRLEISWPNTVALAQLADEMEFEALVPVARWAGFGGATNPQGPGFEAYTWAAGISGATRKTGVVSTSHVSLNHPIISAKQCAAIDHISNGRFTLNIVCGWNGPEMDMFNIPLQGHEERYECAEEWLSIVKRLWTQDETFDHSGKFYTIRKGYLAPKPLQQPYPAIMNAGGSERGRKFACQHADMVYTVIRNTDPELNRAHVQAYHALRQGVRAQDPGLEPRQHRAGRDREGSARVLRLLRPPEGRLRGRRQRGQRDGGRDQRADVHAGADQVDGGSVRRRLGRQHPDRHQGADRRRARAVCELGSRRVAAGVSALSKRACASSAT